MPSPLRLDRLKIRELLNRLPFRISQRVEDFVSDPDNIQTFALWTSAVVAALISVTYAKLFRWAEDLFALLLEQHPYAIFAITPLSFILAWILVKKLSPEAAGSGIPQIMAANEADYEGPHRPLVDRLLSLKTAAVKIASSLICVMGGGAIGREGPTLQICTSVFHFFGKQVRRVVTRTDEHKWVVAGAAAGLASAFNTPLGGIVYAIEELGLVSFHKIRSALLSGVIVSGLVAQWILGSYLYFGFPRLTPVGFSMVPISAVNGIITGICGAIFGRLLILFLNKRLAIKKSSSLATVTILCGLILASLCFIDGRAAGNGTDVINGFLFRQEVADFRLIAFRFIGTGVSYLSGAAGGIFAPSLAIGASVGSFLAQFMATDYPNLMVLLGMIGFLTGVTRTPFTSFILVLEMTDRHSAIFPMMLTALTALWAARWVDKRSFYEHVKDRYLSPPTSPKT